jgi:hypothetical protein
MILDVTAICRFHRKSPNEYGTDYVVNRYKGTVSRFVFRILFLKMVHVKGAEPVSD